MKKAFIDVTPVLYLGNGKRVELGTVRYTMDVVKDFETYEERVWPYATVETQPQSIDSHGTTKIAYRTRLVDGDVAQPERIEEQ